MTTFRVAALVFWAAAGSSAAELTIDQWRADLSFLANELPPRHRNAFHQITRPEFERRVKELDTAIPHLQEFQIRAGITELVAAIGDGHTRADLASDRVFDLNFLEFPEGLIIAGGAKDQGDAIGARVVAIDGIPAVEVRKRLGRFVAMENEFSGLAYIPLLHNVAAMRAAGIMRSPDSAELLLEKNGRPLTITVRSRLSSDPRPEWARPSFTPPLKLKNPRSYYWSEYLPDAKALYIQYNSCQEMPSLMFQRFTEQVIEQARRETPEKLVIDLRNNSGGNSEVSNPLLEAMRTKPALRPRGGVYILVGPDTYSSGLLVALQFREAFHALVAGEPTIERPNHYGYVQTFRLPNSGIVTLYATRHFFPVEGDPPALMPELRPAVTAADYFSGRDPVLDAVLKLPPSMETNFRDAIARDPGCVRAYIELARIYYEKGRAGDVEAVLKNGIAANRSDAIPRVALAELYEAQKKYEEARQMLRIDPPNAAALFELGKVEAASRNFAAAEAALRQCFRLEPENLRALTTLADLYARQNKGGEAIRMLQDEADRDPANTELRLYAGKFAAAIGKFDVAAGEYQKVVQRLGKRAPLEFWMELGEIYRRKGDAAAAIGAFHSQWDVLSEAMRSMGLSAGMAIGPVRGYYEQALRREPKDTILMYCVAFLRSQSEVPADRDSARGILQTALQANPSPENRKAIERLLGNLN